MRTWSESIMRYEPVTELARSLCFQTTVPSGKKRYVVSGCPVSDASCESESREDHIPTRATLGFREQDTRSSTQNKNTLLISNQRGEMHDAAGQFFRVASFGDEFQVAHVLADGRSFSVSIDEAGERLSYPLPIFSNALKRIS